MKRWRFLHCLKVLLLVTLAVALAGFVTKSLWNCLVPELFNGPYIHFGQALGLLLLARLFFGFPFRGKGCCGCGGQGTWKGGPWRRKFEEKLASMSPEEREKFRKAWKQRCGPWGGGDIPVEKSTDS